MARRTRAAPAAHDATVPQKQRTWFFHLKCINSSLIAMLHLRSWHLTLIVSITTCSMQRLYWPFIGSVLPLLTLQTVSRAELNTLFQHWTSSIPRLMSWYIMTVTAWWLGLEKSCSSVVVAVKLLQHRQNSVLLDQLAIIANLSNYKMQLDVDNLQGCQSLSTCILTQALDQS
jgi:hypothetical protein